MTPSAAVLEALPVAVYLTDAEYTALLSERKSKMQTTTQQQR